MFSQEKWSEIKSSCESLLDCVAAIGGEGQVKDRETIQRIIRKLTIATVLDGRAVVGVAGLQGSGKTTLIRGLYDLPDNILVPTSGRGERLPILITEEEIETPAAFRMVLEQQEGNQDGWTIHTESVELEDLDKDAANGGNAGTMLLELHVPRPERRGGGLFPSLLLLPGFEGKNDEHEALIEFSIRCSGTCVYVSSKQQNAKESNKKQLEKLQKIFADRKPIYALSFSDLTDDDNEGFRGTFLEEHPDEDGERVICVGRTKAEQWVPLLEAQILKCAYTAPERTQVQEKLLLELLGKDFEQLLDIADRYKRAIKLTDTLGGDDKYLVTLDKYFRELRPQIAQALHKAMEEYETNSLSYLKNHWEQPKGFAAFKRALFGMSTKEIFQIEQRVEDAIQCKRAAGRQDDPAPQDCIAAYLDGTQESLRRIGTQQLTPELKQDIGLLLRPELAPYKQFQSVKDKDDIMPVLSAIPKVAAHTFLSVVDRGFREGFSLEQPQSQDQSEYLTDLAKGGLDAQKALLLLLGIDFVPDGKLDFIPAVAKALEIPLPAAVAGLAAAATMGMILKNWRDRNRRDVSELYEARKAIHNFYQDQEKKYLDAYDQYCGEIHRQVEENLISMYGLNRGSAAVLNIYIAIGDLRDAYYEIYKEIRSQRIQPRLAVER